MASDFVVLSHREPYEAIESEDSTIELRRKTNGVFTTLDAVMRQKHGTWIAWREQAEGSGFCFTPSDGFTELWELKRLDISVEARALKPEFRNLFSASELAVCRRRLGDYKWLQSPPWQPPTT